MPSLIEPHIMKYLISFLFLVLTTLPSSAATLAGTVYDSLGAVIPNAYVVINWDSVGLDGVKDEDNVGTKEIRVTTTNGDGYFSFELPVGVYDIFVSRAGYAPHCEKVTVKAKESVPFEFRLSVSRAKSSITVY